MTGAAVNRDLPDNCPAAGVPAKIVKRPDHTVSGGGDGA